MIAYIYIYIYIFISPVLKARAVEPVPRGNPVELSSLSRKSSTGPLLRPRNASLLIIRPNKVLRRQPDPPRDMISPGSDPPGARSPRGLIPPGLIPPGPFPVWHVCVEVIIFAGGQERTALNSRPPCKIESKSRVGHTASRFFLEV